MAVAGVLLAALLACADGRVVTPARTQELFHTPYKSHDSRHFKIEASSTFEADAERRFDLSYADGSELKGFTAHDIVHVCAPALFSRLLDVNGLCDTVESRVSIWRRVAHSVSTGVS